MVGKVGSGGFPTWQRFSHPREKWEKCFAKNSMRRGENREKREKQVFPPETQQISGVGKVGKVFLYKDI